MLACVEDIGVAKGVDPTEKLPTLSGLLAA